MGFIRLPPSRRALHKLDCSLVRIDGAGHLVGITVRSHLLKAAVSVFVLTQHGDEFAQIQQDLYLRILDAAAAAGAAAATVAPQPNPPESNVHPHLNRFGRTATDTLGRGLFYDPTKRGTA